MLCRPHFGPAWPASQSPGPESEGGWRPPLGDEGRGDGHIGRNLACPASFYARKNNSEIKSRMSLPSCEEALERVSHGSLG